MHQHLLELLIFLVAAIVAVPLFRYFKLGAILAYLFAGVVIGPGGLSLIGDHETILHVSELGVVFLLFLIGLELQPRRIWSMRHDIFVLGGSQVLACGVLLAWIVYTFGLDGPAAVVAGFGLALSSTAFALQLLQEQHQLKTLHGQGAFSILLLQDLAVVPLIALVPILAGTGGSATAWGVLKAISIVAAFILFGVYAIRHVFRVIAESRVQEVFTASALFVVIGSALLMEQAGLSMGTGAFLAGVLLANSEYRHELEANLEPFKGLLLGLFFIAVGMALDLGVVASKPHYVVTAVVILMSVKATVIYILARLYKYPVEAARNIAVTLPQGGEFAFVLFTAAAAEGLFDRDVNAILTASVTISMALTPLLFALNQRWLRTYSEISERPYDKISAQSVDVIIGGYGRFGQIVARFLQSQGIRFTILDHSAGQVDVARRFGAEVYYGDASREDIVASAGGRDAKVFVLAIDDPDDSVKTATMVRKHFPHIKIIARVRNRQHAIDMLELGVVDVHRETYLTSLEVAKEVLIELGGIREQINPKLAIFRQHDEAILRKQRELRHDEKQMMSFTTQAIEELERVLSADVDSKQNPAS